MDPRSLRRPNGPLHYVHEGGNVVIGDNLAVLDASHEVAIYPWRGGTAGTCMSNRDYSEL